MHPSDDVRRLHSALACLGYTLADEEWAAAEAGPTTRLAVLDVQRAQGLTPTGAADAATLAALARQLEGRAPEYRVMGVVRHPNGRPAVGVRVHALDRDLRREEFLGEARTNARGGFEIPYSADRFARAGKGTADLLLRVYRERAPEGMRERLMNLAGDEPLEELNDPGPEDVLFNAPHVCWVEVRLARGDTRAESEWERLSRELPPLLDGVDPQDLREDAETRDLTFLHRETGWPAQTLAHFAVAHRLAERAAEVPAEYFFALLRENALLGAGPGGVRLAVGLDDETEPLFHDAVLLEPDAARAAVARAVEHGVVPAALAGRVDAILERLAKYRDAAREHVRDERPRRLLRQAERLLQGGAAERVLEVLGRDAKGDLPGLLARLQEALRTDGTGDDQNGGQNGGGDGSAVAALLGPGAGVMEQVREQHGLAAGDDARPLARLNRAEWTEALDRAAPAAKGEQAPGAARLHASALARGLERRFPTPAFAAQLEREGGAASHREGMLRLFSEHPDFDLATTNIEAFFQDHPGLEAGEGHREQTAVMRAGDGMEAATHAEDAAGARPEPGAASARSLKESLKATQRVFRLAPTFRQTTALLDAGVDSAAAIQSMGETRFVERFGGGRVFADGEAREVFHRAANVSTAASLLAGELQSASAALQVGAFASAGAAPQIQQVTTTFPSLKSLFQTGDACECTHCRSVHSPAAYLVDVLLFLRNRRVVDASAPAVDVKAALGVLLGRRPDLGDLQLDCANTETEVPYIDLVCELLEEAVAPDPGFPFTGAAPDGLVPAALLAALQAEGLPFTARAVVSRPDLSGAVVVHDDLAVCKLTPAGAGVWTVRRLRQTHGTSAERGALPEYVNGAAYAALTASRVAFALPFDLHAEETRAYLRQFEVRRDELMRALRNGGPTGAEIAAEAWEIGPVERGLISTPDAAGQDTYWNTGGTPAADALRSVDAFLTRTGMEYAELEALLRMPWIDPDGDLFIRHLDSSCDTAKKEIPNLDAAALDRIHRFLRLMRKTGWPAAVLEQAVRAARLGGGSMADPFLERLEGAERVSTRLALPREEVCAFYGELPAAGERSLHARVFLDPVVVGTVEPDFRPEALRANEDAEAAVAGSGQPLSAYADALATALGLPRPDLGALAGVAGVGTLLSAGNLARLFALSRLARALRMGGEELAVLAGLTGGDPLATPADTLAFLDRAQRVRDAGTTPSGLRYLLRHEAPDLGARALADVDATRILQALQQGYRAAQAENRSPFDIAAAAAENQAAVKPLLSRLPGFTEAELSAFEAVLEGTSTLTVPQAAALIDQKLGGVTNTTPVKAAQAALAALGAGASEAQREAARNALLQTVLDGVAAYLYAAARDTLLLPAVAAAFSIPEDVAGVLLRAGRLRHPAALGTPTLGAVLASTDLAAAANTVADPPAPLPPALDTQLRALRLLHKAAQLAGTLGASPPELEWLLANAGDLGWLRPDELRYQADPAVPAASLASWEALRDGLALRRAWPPVPDPADARAPLTFFALLDRVLAGEPAAAVTAHLARLAGWDPAVVTDLHTRFGLGAAALAAYHDPATYRRLEAAVSLLRRLGLSVAEGVGVAAPAPGAADAARMRAALRARHAESEWLGVLRGVQDRLRTRKRDALVAHLLAANPALGSTTDLFDHFLLDVEMGACRITSRVVQAHGTVQLFVQRCLMGLEPRSIASVARDDGWAQWPWMREYRVWEANRKVFLWPENWIEPELRDDQSELFAELLNELQQNELTDRAVEDAAAAYLRRLDAIALLEPMAALYEPERAWMHVFARTKGGDPAVYYYRRFEKERYWTPWEKVDADIKGDHLMAFTRNGRLFLAWPEFSEEPREEQTASVPSSGGGTQTLDAPEKRWKIRFAIAERSGGRWLPKKVSQGALYSPPPPDYTTQLPPAERYRFAVADMGAAGHVVTCTLGDGGESSYQGAFALFGCKGYPEPVQGGPDFTSSLVFLPHFADTAVRSMRYRELPPGTVHTPAADDLAIRTILDVGAFHSLFNATPGVFKVTYPHQLSLVDLLFILAQLLGGGGGDENRAYVGRGRFVIPLGTFMPFFYEDALRAFTLVPGFYEKQADDPAKRIERTFSDIHQLLVDILALAALYYQKLADDPDHDLQKLVDALVKDPEYIRILEEVKVYLKLKYGYEVHALYHPLMCFLRSELDRGGIPALMRRETQLFNTGFDFSRPDQYAPQPAVVPPYPVETLDFARDGAYSAYNWELFFHLPFTIATRLSADQRFEAAQAWFHYIFNPVGAGDAPAPRRYWVTKPFFLKQPAEYQAERIDAIFNVLAANPTGAAVGDLRFAVSEWRSKPFKPHVIARSRPVAYQQAVVMKYIQNLIEWGDHEFRRYTQESVNRATQLYLMADRLLGPRPRTVPPLARPRPETYRQLEARADLFGNALVELENLIPDLGLLPEGGAELPPQQPPTLSSLYFCIPQNERMLEYWDRVAERLDNLRHCRNIEGVEAPMSLFAPPIDPGALVRAAAAGLDLSAVLAGLGAPLPFYRFQVMAQKATELAQQVAGLGGALLAALEKRDAEALARLRSGQELLVLAAAREVKLRQIDEATQAIVALQASRAVIEERKAYYGAQVYMNPWEITSVALAGTALVIETAMAVGYILSGGLKLVPQFMIGAAGFGGSPTANASTGGDSFGNSAEDAVKTMSAIAQALDKAASMAATQGGYQRRQEEWDYQVTIADAELRQMDQQLESARIRVDILQKELATHDRQVAAARASDDFMRTKFTGQELYEWTAGQVSSVYFRAYQLAFGAARAAERCFRHELGSDASFLRYGYWDSRRKGLMAAELLLHDVKRMEVAYLEQNRREYELTKHVSLAQLDPDALIQLRNTGACTLRIPEAAFDLDHPGHYMRRLKSVAVSIPAVAGPYSAVGCKLSLVSHRYRKSTALLPAGTPVQRYAEAPGNDPRFVYNAGSLQSIATSTGQSDTGMFELNFRDDRYLPFEGAGAVGIWRIELPTAFRNFDYATITDVVLQLRYTARDGGGAFRTKVEAVLSDLLNAVATAAGTGLFQAFSLRHQFPDEWSRLQSGQEAEVTLRAAHLPFFTHGHTPQVQSLGWVARLRTNAGASYTITINGADTGLAKQPSPPNPAHLYRGDTATVALGTAFTLAVDTPANLEELTLLVGYSLTT